MSKICIVTMNAKRPNAKDLSSSCSNQLHEAELAALRQNNSKIAAKLSDEELAIEFEKQFSLYHSLVADGYVVEFETEWIERDWPKPDTIAYTYKFVG